jgi:excisionase family DNA binding protein
MPGAVLPADIDRRILSNGELMDRPQQHELNGKTNPAGLMKVREVARRLSCSESLVRAIIASGRLKHYRLGEGQGGIRVSEEQLHEFLRTSEEGEGPSPPSPKPSVRRTPLKHLRA